jgi:EAL domain-containing protein (putative c-di-GMP-specific phosphodiesterase class I)
LARPDPAYFPGPVELFTAAAVHNVAGELGRLIRTLAIDGCSAWPLFLNVHPAEFNEGYLVRPDDPIFAHDPGVCLEITESVPITHFCQCHSVLKEIRSKGVNLAVDDLGAGYSNLKYIADLAPEVVKLDRELISSVDKGPRHLKLVANIVRLCEELGSKVVVEGIETVEELRAVGDSGAHYGQGYFLARPSSPPPEMSPWPLSITIKN